MPASVLELIRLLTSVWDAGFGGPASTMGARKSRAKRKLLKAAIKSVEATETAAAATDPNATCDACDACKQYCDHNELRDELPDEQQVSDKSRGLEPKARDQNVMRK